MTNNNQLSKLTSNPWEARNSYAQRDLGTNSPAKLNDQNIESLLNFFGIKELVDLQKPESSYEAVNNFVNEKVAETFNAKTKVGAGKQPIDTIHNQELASRYYGPIDSSKKYQSKKKDLGTLVNFKNLGAAVKATVDNAELKAVHHGEFRKGLAAGFGIRRNADGEITIAEFQQGAIKKNILRLYPNGEIIFKENSSLSRKDREKITQTTSSQGTLSSTELTLADQQALVLAPNGLAFNGLIDAKFSRAKGQLIDFLGRVFEGEFAENLPNKGTLINKHGIKETGSFSKKTGFLNRAGQKEYKNGAITFGNWDHGIANGDFKIKFPNKTELSFKLKPDMDINQPINISLTGASGKNKYNFNGFVSLQGADLDPREVYLDDHFVQNPLLATGNWEISKDQSQGAVYVDFYNSGKIRSAQLIEGLENPFKFVLNKKPFNKGVLNIAQNNPISFFKAILSGLENRKLLFNPIQKEIETDFAWTKDVKSVEENKKFFQDSVAKMLERAEQLDKEVEKAKNGDPKYRKIDADQGTGSAIYFDKNKGGGRDFRKDPQAIYYSENDDYIEISCGKLDRKGRVSGPNVARIIKDKTDKGYVLGMITMGPHSKGQLNGHNCLSYQHRQPDPEVGRVLHCGIYKKDEAVKVGMYADDGSRNYGKNTKDGQGIEGVFTDSDNNHYKGRKNNKRLMEGPCQMFSNIKGAIDILDMHYYSNYNSDNDSRIVYFPKTNAFMKFATKSKDSTQTIEDCQMFVNGIKVETTNHQLTNAKPLGLTDVPRLLKEKNIFRPVLEQAFSANGHSSIEFPNGATVIGNIKNNRLDDEQAQLLIFDDAGEAIELTAHFKNGKLVSFTSNNGSPSDNELRTLIDKNIGTLDLDLIEIYSNIFNNITMTLDEQIAAAQEILAEIDGDNDDSTQQKSEEGFLRSFFKEKKWKFWGK